MSCKYIRSLITWYHIILISLRTHNRWHNKWMHNRTIPIDRIFILIFIFRWRERLESQCNPNSQGSKNGLISLLTHFHSCSVTGIHYGTLATAGMASLYLKNCVSRYCYGDSRHRQADYPLHETSIIPLPLIRDIDHQKGYDVMYIQWTHNAYNKVYSWNSIQVRDVNIKSIINIPDSPDRLNTIFSMFWMLC